MKYTNFKTKYNIQIPKNIKIFYCNEKKIITFVGPLKKKSLKVEIKILFSNLTNSLIVTDLTENRKLINKKKTKILQGTTISLIKQILIEVNHKLYHKLKFIGVGYRSFKFDNPIENQIYLKLGYSHMIYFKIPDPAKTYIIKFTTLFIFGKLSYESITQLTSSIRNCKLPEPYKGKGILYYEERIDLKKGKKI